jgi:hypothetical protein
VTIRKGTWHSRQCDDGIEQHAKCATTAIGNDDENEEEDQNEDEDEKKDEEEEEEDEDEEEEDGEEDGGVDNGECEGDCPDWDALGIPVDVVRMDAFGRPIWEENAPIRRNVYAWEDGE